jgi:hypothetical protein
MPLEHRFSALLLFSNSGKSPYSFICAVAMVQNCHFQSSVGNRRQGQLHASQPGTGSCHLHPLKNPRLLPEKWAKTSVVGILQHLHNKKRFNPK